MNWNSFNALGYLSVILWLAMPLMWLVHSKMKPKRWLVHASVLVGVLALVFAKINSETHVNRIQQDMSEQLAAFRAEQEAKRQAELDARGDEVAQIRFAEDGSDDFLDRAGLDESELKYRDKLEQPEDPEWMNKKERSAGGAADDSLEGMIGGVEESKGVESETLDETQDKEPIIMVAEDLQRANMLDGLNLKMVRLMLVVAVLLVILDYLKRANVYAESYLPLPLPSGWTNGMKAPVSEFVRPEPGRRDLPGELAWMVKRGESFVFITDDPTVASSVPAQLPRLGKNGCPMEVIRVGTSAPLVSDGFVFETAWYGRGAFVVDSCDRGVEMLKSFVELLGKRHVTRAHVRQNLNLVWACGSSLPEELRAELKRLGASAGLNLFLINS